MSYEEFKSKVQHYADLANWGNPKFSQENGQYRARLKGGYTLTGCSRVAGITVKYPNHQFMIH